MDRATVVSPTFSYYIPVTQNPEISTHTHYIYIFLHPGKQKAGQAKALKGRSSWLVKEHGLESVSRDRESMGAALGIWVGGPSPLLQEESRHPLPTPNRNNCRVHRREIDPEAVEIPDIPNSSTPINFI